MQRIDLPDQHIPAPIPQRDGEEERTAIHAIASISHHP
jgi:hypothetical protein